ncbi:MAG: 5-oxoprolinase subunit PxpA [Thermodesulfobacteriota bacterium]|nr:5-oxoprolinase subunit PxpA [Thermodesulfobacteriota bacterium]
MEQRHKIDLNSDVGESFGAYKIGLDEEVIPLITSANIACGFHAGDPHIMRQTIALANSSGTAIGVHPGLPDLMGFGRRYMDATIEEIKDYFTYQMGSLSAFAVSQGTRLQHVKAHGALYNMAVKDVRIWESMAEVISMIDKKLILVVLSGVNIQELKDMGKKYGIKVAFEFFADREYNLDGSLVSRKEPGAVIKDHQKAAERVIKMITEGKILTKDGAEIQLSGDTICVHGDNPAAVNLIKQIRTTLSESKIDIVPMGEFL